MVIGVWFPKVHKGGVNNLHNHYGHLDEICSSISYSCIKVFDRLWKIGWRTERADEIMNLTGTDITIRENPFLTFSPLVVLSYLSLNDFPTLTTNNQSGSMNTWTSSNRIKESVEIPDVQKGRIHPTICTYVAKPFMPSSQASKKRPRGTKDMGWTI